MKPILCVVGARPNYMKIAPLLSAFAKQGMPAVLVHTGQHYDEAMNDGFFRALSIPEPVANLSVGSASHAQQTALVMQRFEPELDRIDPSAVLVVGDVNSTLACALVANKKGYPVVHVEAGLRSRDRSMPEEINRLLTDQLSDFLFTTERSADLNLLAEGIAAERIHFVGNVMIDTLFRLRPEAIPAPVTLGSHHFTRFALSTLHRPALVDNESKLQEILLCLRDIATNTLPVVMALHPRTRATITRFGLEDLIMHPHIAVLPPQGYLNMLGLMQAATVILTDSGGIQEESTALGVPCLTLRENTERPITIEQGTNTLVGLSPLAIRQALAEVVNHGGKAGRAPEYWDGKASERIAAILKKSLDA
ncbi:MAG: hypothetical protein RLZZ502_1656 [Pseudomonadota bacterium]|jgi:UDP-N-acetylglucosamine 2-epimerase (non-hydrolysing)